jgi:hypothetical protein
MLKVQGEMIQDEMIRGEWVLRGKTRVWRIVRERIQRLNC